MANWSLFEIVKSIVADNKDAATRPENSWFWRWYWILQLFGRCASLFWETFGQGLDVDGQTTDERYHQVLQGFLEIKNAGCANLDVVDLPEKCSMLQEPPFKIEETVARRWETLEFVWIQWPRLAGWGMKLHEYQLYTPYKERRVHSVLSFRKAIMIKAPGFEKRSQCYTSQVSMKVKSKPRWIYRRSSFVPIKGNN